MTASLLLVVSLTSPLTTPIVMAQSSKGIRVGTVMDPTGAVISSATVRVSFLAALTHLYRDYRDVL